MHTTIEKSWKPHKKSLQSMQQKYFKKTSFLCDFYKGWFLVLILVSACQSLDVSRKIILYYQ